MVAAPGGSDPAPAHVWRVSGQAYAGIRRGAERGTPESQTIVISGESGAGKTESARLLQSHLLRMSALAPELSEATLAQTLLQSTLLLEAFGNARTTASSPNSSRFGKFSVLVYDEKAQVTGAYIEAYLLETSRLVWREAGQRSFHVLYMLCISRNAAARFSLPIQPAPLYRWLRAPEDTGLTDTEGPHSESTGGADEARRPPPFRSAAGIDMSSVLDPDEAELRDRFDAICASLGQCGVPEQQLGLLWQLLTALLYLGNLDFESAPKPKPAASALGAAEAASGAASGVEMAIVTPFTLPSAQVAASLLGVPPAQLVFALTHKVMLVGGVASGPVERGTEKAMGRAGGATDYLRVPLSVKQASAVQHGAAQGIYSAVFAWLLRVINAALAPRPVLTGMQRLFPGAAAAGSNAGAGGGGASVAAAPAQSGTRAFVGVLDLFGFETLRHSPSSFEQLCINTANERVQQHFNLVLLAELLAEWRSEGLSESNVPSSVQHASASTGASGSPRSESVAQLEAGSCIALLESPAHGLFSLLDTQTGLATGSDQAFARELGASAGAGGRHSKLRMPTGTGSGYDFAIVHYAGEVRYSAAGFVAKNTDPLPVHVANLFRESSNQLLASLFANADAGSEGGSRAQSKAMAVRAAASRRSVSAKFRKSLSELMRTIAGTTSHFVRCIKPNAAGTPGVFDRALVVQQLQSAGVLEIARIYGAGFPVRLPFADFVSAYGAVHPPARSLLATGHAAEAVLMLLTRAAVEPELFRLGATKLFAKRILTDALDRAAFAAAKAASLSLQSATRALIARRRGDKRANAAVLLQAAARRVRARSAVSELRSVHDAETRSLAEKAYKTSTDAARRMQAHLRGHRTRVETAELERRARLAQDDARASAVARAGQADSAEAVTPRGPPPPPMQAGGASMGAPKQQHSAIRYVLEQRIDENVRTFDLLLGQPGAAVGARLPPQGSERGAAEPVASGGGGGGGSAAPPAPEVEVTRLARALSWGRKPPAGSAPMASAAADGSAAAGGKERSAPPTVSPVDIQLMLNSALTAFNFKAGGGGADPTQAAAPANGTVEWVSAQLEARAAQVSAPAPPAKRMRPGLRIGARRKPQAKRDRPPEEHPTPAAVGEAAGTAGGDTWAAELETQLGPMRQQQAGSALPFFGLPAFFGSSAGQTPIVQPPTDADESGESLSSFLQSNGLAAYLPNLAAEEITLPDLKLLTDVELKELGLKVGPRARLKDAIKRRFGHAPLR